jgi:hypothetical protein
MKSLASLTIAVTCFAFASWVGAFEPRTNGPLPAVLEPPVPGEVNRPAARERLVSQAEPADADESKPASAAPRSPASEIKKARELLLKCSSIQARIVENIAVGDRSYRAEGTYLQTGLKPNDWHLRLELALKVGESEGSLLEVCDGDVLWTSMTIDTGRKGPRKDKKKDQTITRRNVTQILNAARKLNDAKTETQIVTSMGLGGLPALLAAIERDMRLTAVKDEMLRDRPVTVIHATWTENVAAQWSSAPEKGGTPLLPPFVPEQARIYLDRETGFPLRFLYQKRLPGRDVWRPILTLDFLDVVLNEPINKSAFAYEPPSGVQPVELTNIFLDQLGLRETQAQGAAKAP